MSRLVEALATVDVNRAKRILAEASIHFLNTVDELEADITNVEYHELWQAFIQTARDYREAVRARDKLTKRGYNV